MVQSEEAALLTRPGAEGSWQVPSEVFRQQDWPCAHSATQQTVFVLSIVFQLAILRLGSYNFLVLAAVLDAMHALPINNRAEPVDIAAKYHDAALATTMLPVPFVTAKT